MREHAAITRPVGGPRARGRLHRSQPGAAAANGRPGRQAQRPTPRCRADRALCQRPTCMPLCPKWSLPPRETMRWPRSFGAEVVTRYPPIRGRGDPGFRATATHSRRGRQVPPLALVRAAPWFPSSMIWCGSGSEPCQSKWRPSGRCASTTVGPDRCAVQHAADARPLPQACADPRRGDRAWHSDRRQRDRAPQHLAGLRGAGAIAAARHVLVPSLWVADLSGGFLQTSSSLFFFLRRSINSTIHDPANVVAAVRFVMFVAIAARALALARTLADRGGLRARGPHPAEL